MSKKILIVGLLLFVFSLSVRLYGIDRTDETWDEISNVVHGQIYLGALKNLDFSREVWEIGSDHFPFAKYIYGLSMQLPEKWRVLRNLDSEFPEGRNFTMPRIAASILGSLTVVVVFAIGYISYGFWEGVFSASIYSLLPHVIGHNRIAGLETPLTFFLSIFFLCILYALKEKKYKYISLSGIFLGLGLSCRFDLASFGIFYLILFIFSKELRRNYKYLLTGGVLALATPFLIWPWLWIDKLNIWNVVMRVFSTGGVRYEYFFGNMIVPPDYYYLPYLAVTTPPIVLFILILSLLTLLRNDARKKVSALILLLWIFLSFQASFSWYKQDGIRYILHMYPAIALICGVGIVSLLRSLDISKAVYLLVLLTVYAVLMVTSLLYYPYYIDYYNIIAGGPRRVYIEDRFEIGWWGEGLYQSVMYLNKNAPANSSVSFFIIPAHTLPSIREDIEVYLSGEPLGDFVIVNTQFERYNRKRFNALLRRERFQLYDLVYTSNIQGAPLVKVYKRKDVGTIVDI